MNRILALTAALLCAVPALSRQDDALTVLVRALDAQRDVKVSMMQKRRDGTDGITVCVQIQPHFGVTASVVSPISYAGMTSFDDGSTWKNYDPQRDVLRIEPSPMKFQMDIGLRSKLIKKNYRASFGADSVVAGREVKVVQLTPIASEVASRTLYIDRANSLILKYIVTEPSGDSTVTVETMSVDLWSPIDLTQYTKLGSGAEKVEKSWGPIEVSRESDARSYVGFTPTVPSSLPAGLAKQAIHIVGTAERSFVGVRLTDGMAVVTVYLWKVKDGERPTEAPLGGKYDLASGDIRIKVFGDATAAVKSSLAKLFAVPYGGPRPDAGT